MMTQRITGGLTIAFALLFVLLLKRMRGHSDALGLGLYTGLWATLFDSFHVDVEDFRHVWLLFGICASYGHSAVVTDEGTTSHPARA